MRNKWITFDLDGTLMQNPFVGHVFPELEERIGKELDREMNVTRVLVAEHEHRMKQERYVDAYDWDGIVQTVLEREGISLDIDVEQIVLKHCVAPKVYMLEDSIPQVLQELKDEGYSLAVATNGFMKYQAPVLKAIGIFDFFDKIITPELVGAGKPDINMLKELDSQSIVAHVGDRMDHDIYLANRLNVPSILISRRLPDELEALPPQDRAQHEASIEMCLQKLQKETGEQQTELTPLYRPKAIIKSMNELRLCL